MSILVTGSSGFIGSNIIRILYERGHRPIGYDISGAGSESVLWDIKDKIKYVQGTMLDLSHILRVVKDYKVEGIIHTAGLLVLPSNQRPIDAARVNIEGTLNVLETARIMNLRRVVCCSTIEVIGVTKDLKKPIREDDPPLLPYHNMYAVFKLAIEGFCHNYQNLFGVSALAIRPSMVYGPGLVAERIPRHPISFLINEAVNGRNVDMKTGADTPIDFQYVKDLADGIIKAYEAKAPKYNLYNMGNGNVCWPAQAIDVLQKLFPKLTLKVNAGIWPGWIPTVESAKNEDREYHPILRAPIDINRARLDLGYKPHGLDKTIRDYVKWLQNREYVLPENM